MKEGAQSYGKEHSPYHPVARLRKIIATDFRGVIIDPRPVKRGTQSTTGNTVRLYGRN